MNGFAVFKNEATNKARWPASRPFTVSKRGRERETMRGRVTVVVGQRGRPEREREGDRTGWSEASQANGGLTSGHLQHGLCAGQCFLHSMRNAFV